MDQVHGYIELEDALLNPQEGPEILNSVVNYIELLEVDLARYKRENDVIYCAKVPDSPPNLPEERPPVTPLPPYSIPPSTGIYPAIILDEHVVSATNAVTVVVGSPRKPTGKSRFCIIV